MPTASSVPGESVVAVTLQLIVDSSDVAPSAIESAAASTSVGVALRRFLVCAVKNVTDAQFPPTVGGTYAGPSAYLVAVAPRPVEGNESAVDAVASTAAIRLGNGASVNGVGLADCGAGVAVRRLGANGGNGDGSFTDAVVGLAIANATTAAAICAGAFPAAFAAYTATLGAAITAALPNCSADGGLQVGPSGQALCVAAAASGSAGCAFSAASVPVINVTCGGVPVAEKNPAQESKPTPPNDAVAIGVAVGVVLLLLLLVLLFFLLRWRQQRAKAAAARKTVSGFSNSARLGGPRDDDMVDVVNPMRLRVQRRSMVRALPVPASLSSPVRRSDGVVGADHAWAASSSMTAGASDAGFGSGDDSGAATFGVGNPIYSRRHHASVREAISSPLQGKPSYRPLQASQRAVTGPGIAGGSVRSVASSAPGASGPGLAGSFRPSRVP